jgi:hypothetical protein
MVAQINEIPRKEISSKRLTLTQTTFDVQAMYPSLNADFLIKEISEICINHIDRAIDAEMKKERENTHILTMRILIFLLEHNFMVADLGFDKRESFFRTTQGIPTGAKNSGDLANLALLNRENRIYKDLRAKGLTLLLQNRYIDDGTLAWLSPQREVETNLKMVTSACDNGFPTPIKFDWAEKAMHLPLQAKQGTFTESPKREYLDLNIHYTIDNTPAGSRLTLHHTTYKKACSGDLYIHWRSAHKKDEKINLPLNQRNRFLINASHKIYFDEAWSTFREVLIARKHPPEELDIIEEKIQWDQKQDINRTRSDKKKRRHQEKTAEIFIP